MIRNLFFLLLIPVLFSSCKEQALLFDDFGTMESLDVTDSIRLEKYGILNPHYIYCKDSFLIFNSMRGKQEIQLLDLTTRNVYEYSVIGQGKNEMAHYWTVCNEHPCSYEFVDNQRGYVYGVNLDSLRQNPATRYELLYSLPIDEGVHFFRFLETQKYIVGIGILHGGRFGVYEKQTYSYKEQMTYPTNEDIDKLANPYKGALFSRTLLASDMQGKKMVAGCFGLLDFYTISEQGDISLEKSNHYHFPLFEANLAGGGAIAYKKEDITGITGLVADGKYVYALYSDKTFGNDGESAYNASHLLVFDWNGMPVKHYRLSKDLYGISLCGNRIYGLSREKEPIVYCYDLFL